jgi:hypothetical protein
VQSHSVDSISVAAVALGDFDGDGSIDYAVADGQRLTFDVPVGFGANSMNAVSHE